MGTPLSVDPAALAAAHGALQQVGDGLGAIALPLAALPYPMGGATADPSVASALDDFAAVWSQVYDRIAHEAQATANALEASSVGYEVADVMQAAEHFAGRIFGIFG